MRDKQEMRNRANKQRTVMGREGVEGTTENTNQNIPDLPCMHLDPGVNRLGFNIVHQTDRRPVTPYIVCPICVILQQREEGRG